MYVSVCKQTFMQDIILCAPSWASQHQARATYSNKHHMLHVIKLRFSAYLQTSLCTHIVPH